MEGMVHVNSIKLQVFTEIFPAMICFAKDSPLFAVWRRRTIALGVFVIALPAAAEVNDQLDFRYYNVEATRGKSLADSVREASPINENGHVFFGHTGRDIHWRLHWNNTAGGGCKITEVHVTLHTTIILPQLSNADSRQDEFTRFQVALRIHEMGHYRLEQEEAAAIEAAIWSLGEMRNCREVENAANDTGHQLMEEYKKKQVQYDAATEHGKTQGANLRK